MLVWSTLTVGQFIRVPCFKLESQGFVFFLNQFIEAVFKCNDHRSLFGAKNLLVLSQILLLELGPFLVDIRYSW